MTNQTNSRAGSSWRLKMFLRLVCNGTDELCPGATFETARCCIRVGRNDLGRWTLRRDLKKLANVYLCVLTSQIYTNTCTSVHVHPVHDHHSSVILLTMNTPAVQYPRPPQQLTRKIVATEGDLRDTGKQTNMQRWLTLFCMCTTSTCTCTCICMYLYVNLSANTLVYNCRFQLLCVVMLLI